MVVARRPPTSRSRAPRSFVSRSWTMLATVFALALFAGFLVPAVRAEGKEDYGALSQRARSDTSLIAAGVVIGALALRVPSCAVLWSRAALGTLNPSF